MQSVFHTQQPHSLSSPFRVKYRTSHFAALRAAQLHERQLLGRPQCPRLCYCSISSRRDVFLKFPWDPFSQQDPVLRMHTAARKQLSGPAESRNSSLCPGERKRQPSAAWATSSQASKTAISRLWAGLAFWVGTEYSSEKHPLALRKATVLLFSNIKSFPENPLLISLHCTSVILTRLNAGPRHVGSEVQGSLVICGWKSGVCELHKEFLQVVYLGFN